MTLIVHVTGDSDLGLDILNIGKEEKVSLREDRIKILIDLLGALPNDQSVAQRIVDAVFDLRYAGDDSNTRFGVSPIAQILERLKGERASNSDAVPQEGKPERPIVRILLLGSVSGHGDTKRIADTLDGILDNPMIRSLVEERYDLSISTRVLNGGLEERATLEAFEDVVMHNSGAAISDVAINAMSGSTSVLIAALGAVEKAGLPWRLMLAPKPDETAATQMGQHQFSDESEFRWLCALGLLHDAALWAEGKGKDELVTEEIRDYADIAKRLNSSGVINESSLLRKLACLWLMRADNGAGLAVRAWVQAYYEELLQQENRERDEPWVSMFTPSSNGRTPTLGEAIGRIEQQVKDGSPASSAGSWLLTRAALNTIGNSAVHDAAVPTLAALEEARSIPELAAGAPPWMSWPAERPILYLYACGLGGHSHRPSIAERVLSQPPQRALLQAVPAGMLTDEPPLPIALRMIHSSHPNSRNTARQDMAAAIEASHDKRWNLIRGSAPAVQAVEYVADGGDDAGEAEVIQAVRAETALILAQLEPSAVVIVGTGPKGAVLGALQEAQNWCAIHAAPLFLQTFIDPDKAGKMKEPVSQFHRIAMHGGIEKALRKAAAASLRSLNLLSAVRVLSAGDGGMAALAQDCDRLRQEYTNAVTADNLDEHAGVVLGVLKTIVDLWTHAQDDWETRIRLMVAAAEITKCNQIRPKGKMGLLREPTKCLQDEQIKKRREADSPCKVEDLTLGDMQRLLYMIRNRLIITHGAGTIDQAIEDAFVDGQVARNDLSYPDLLSTIVSTLRRDARNNTNILNHDVVKGYVQQSDWAEQFMGLISAVESRDMQNEGKK